MDKQELINQQVLERMKEWNDYLNELREEFEAKGSTQRERIELQCRLVEELVNSSEKQGMIALSWLLRSPFSENKTTDFICSRLLEIEGREKEVRSVLSTGCALGGTDYVKQKCTKTFLLKGY